ncbi:hypothetical protein [Sphingopyxis sp.]|uniref:hypothetical protein n=1 Tax=Sphingopyxis sp. TaxID=1908224 RepID=UPI003D6D34F1
MPYPRRSFFALSQAALLPLLASDVQAVPDGKRRPLSTLSFDSFNELRAFVPADVGVQVLAVVLGAKVPFDGGGGVFLFDSRSSDADDGMSILGAAKDDRGRWRRFGEPAVANQAERLDARWFGAKGDIRSDDTRAIRDLVKAAGPYDGVHAKAAYMQSGLYRLTGSLTPQSFSRVHGDGITQSVLYNFEHKLPDVPVFFTSERLIFSSFENFGMMSQRAGFDIAGETDHNHFANVGCYEMADALFRFRGPLQTSVFDRIVADTSTYGIVCEHPVVNRNTFREPEFKNLRNSAMKFAGAEDVLVIGGRFETGGALGKAILDFSNVRLITFLGGYFEGSHEYILRARNTVGLIAFESVHFTYFRPGVPYKWDVDAKARLVFRNCHSTIPMTVPRGSLLEGVNYNLSVAPR